jgi:hypothetical protein
MNSFLRKQADKVISNSDDGSRVFENSDKEEQHAPGWTFGVFSRVLRMSYTSPEEVNDEFSLVIGNFVIC